MDLLGCYSKRTLWTTRLKRLSDLAVGDARSTVGRQRLTGVHLQADEIAALTDGYRTGAAVKELATRFGIHRTTVSQHLDRNGVTLRRRGLDDEQVDQAVHLYRRGWSLARIGAHLEADAHTVRSALRARGVQMRKANGRT